MRLVMVILLCALGTAAAASLSASANRAADTEAAALARLAADSLVARRQAMPTGGWAWRSAVQAPHYQTDRDVGAAGIGEGLLAAYAVTRDARYRRAAVEAGDYLVGVAEPEAGGLLWPDWADPDGARSKRHFTSFDDGAAGISDYLWRLYEVTRERRFRTAAIAGMRWLVAQAEGPNCPRTACSWKWTDEPGGRVAYYGLGMGQAGIVLALDSFADRTGDASFRAHARAGAAWLRELTANGTRPLPRGFEDPTTFETGFLSGSAGAAYLFLERYRRDSDPVDLATARGLLDWVDRRRVADGAGRTSWPFAAHPGAWTASGFELGVAGIAWVNLQAARTTGEAVYRERALAAGRWLRHVSLGGVWEELPGDRASRLHVGLDSGAAGIGWVLEDLARAGLDPAENRAAARSALAGLRAEARSDRLGAFWFESRTGTRRRLRAEPSWHWGAAGIAAFAARLGGWSGRAPGGQPGA